MALAQRLFEGIVQLFRGDGLVTAEIALQQRAVDLESSLGACSPVGRAAAMGRCTSRKLATN